MRNSLAIFQLTGTSIDLVGAVPAVVGAVAHLVEADAAARARALELGDAAVGGEVRQQHQDQRRRQRQRRPRHPDGAASVNSSHHVRRSRPENKGKTRQG